MTTMQCGRCKKPDCRLCELYDTDARYRAMWDGTPITGGPGTELRKLIAELGLSPVTGCGCNDKAAMMDAWGVDGCKEHRSEIIAWMKEAGEKVGWLEKLKAVAKGILSYGSLVDIAIERAESKKEEPVEFGSFAIHA